MGLDWRVGTALVGAGNAAKVISSSAANKQKATHVWKTIFTEPSKKKPRLQAALDKFPEEMWMDGVRPQEWDSRWCSRASASCA